MCVLDDGREIVPELFGDASPSRVNASEPVGIAMCITAGVAPSGAAPAFFFYGRCHGENQHVQRPGGAGCAIHARRRGHSETLRAAGRWPRSPSPRIAGPVADRSRYLSFEKPRFPTCPDASVCPSSLRVAKSPLFSWAQAGGNSRTVRTGNSLIPGPLIESFFRSVCRKLLPGATLPPCHRRPRPWLANRDRSPR